MRVHSNSVYLHIPPGIDMLKSFNVLSRSAATLSFNSRPSLLAPSTLPSIPPLPAPLNHLRRCLPPLPLSRYLRPVIGSVQR